MGEFLDPVADKLMVAVVLVLLVQADPRMLLALPAAVIIGREITVSAELVVLDGNAGLRRAVHEAWPQTKVQRCTKHKLTNLLAKAPKHSHPALKRDYHAIVYAETMPAARAAYQAFVRKWSKLSAEVVKSLEEAGDELLTFMQFPESQWRALRTTNAIERLNEEFRRRTKTQGSFCNEQAALVLLFGLIAVGQIRMRKIDGHHDLTKALGSAA